jgi:ectoine hydroxylase-related dioxygenase (phytanoyl-CoA dioxygenase family)
VIFNDSPGSRTDRKRKQATLPSSNRVAAIIRSRLVTEFPEKRPSTAILIESRPGCQQQAAHCDYIPIPEFTALSDEAMPLLFLVAIEPGTTLEVWPRSHELLAREARETKETKETRETRETKSRPIRQRTLRLNAGDAVLFRGDLVHAGSAYERANRRIHVYLDNPAHPREPNRTWIIYKHAPVAVRDRIDELA